MRCYDEGEASGILIAMNETIMFPSDKWREKSRKKSALDGGAGKINIQFSIVPCIPMERDSIRLFGRSIQSFYINLNVTFLGGSPEWIVVIYDVVNNILT